METPTMTQLTPEEAAAAYAQFSADVENGLPPDAYDDWANMDTALDDALQKALALAIGRERERCAKVLEDLNNDPEHNEQDLQSREICGWCAATDKALEKIRGEAG